MKRVMLILALGVHGQGNAGYIWRSPYANCPSNGPKENPVHIRGLMNTGTNLIMTMINKDMKTIENNKHMIPSELDKHGRSLDRLNIIMIRHPMSWVTGMHKKPYFLFCENKKDPLRNPNATCELQLMWDYGQGHKERVDRTFSSVIDVWNQYYSSYLTWKGCFLILRYEDLLINPKRSLDAIVQTSSGSQHLPKSKPHLSASLKSPAKKHGHPRSFNDAKSFNLQKKWHSMFSPDQLRSHCRHVNSSLLALFNYTCP